MWRYMTEEFKMSSKQKTKLLSFFLLFFPPGLLCLKPTLHAETFDNLRANIALIYTMSISMMGVCFENKVADFMRIGRYYETFIQSRGNVTDKLWHIEYFYVFNFVLDGNGVFSINTKLEKISLREKKELKQCVI